MRVYTQRTSHKPSCVSVEQVPLCNRREIGYKQVYFPNFRNQYSVEEINAELGDPSIKSLLRSKCSNATLYLLCSIYAPMCITNIYKKGVLRPSPLPPCRQLCEYVVESCTASSFMEAHNLTTTEFRYLNCSQYPVRKDNQFNLCYGPEDLSMLKLIEIEEHSNSSTPLLIKLSVVEAESSRVDIRLSGEGVVAVDTECSPKMHNSNYNGNQLLELRGLAPNTSYSCNVTVHTSNESVQSVNVQFTTLPALGIQLVNGSPFVGNGSLTLSLATTRPVSTIECQFIGADIKGNSARNCSGNTTFSDLPADLYTLRVVANTNNDKATLRFRVRVPAGPGHCLVNLHSQQWTVSQGLLTVWFRAEGPVERVWCVLTQGEAIEESSECSSPFTWPVAGGGDYRLRLLTEGSDCDKKSGRTIKITV